LTTSISAELLPNRRSDFAVAQQQHFWSWGARKADPALIGAGSVYGGAAVSQHEAQTPNVDCSASLG